MSAAKRSIAVFGATGHQGGGLVKALVDDEDSLFAVRAVTRDINSPSAKKLIEQGVEVVQADLDNPKSLDRALSGAYGAFLVTNFWEHFSPQKELQQATHLAEAAKRAGIQHIVWSTLEDTRKRVPLGDDRLPTLQGCYKVPHFDGKGEADSVFLKLGVPVTFLRTSFYWENFLSGLAPTKNPKKDNYVINIPIGSSRLPGIAVKDIGACAYGIFKGGPERYAGQVVGACGEQLTGPQMAKAISSVLGVSVTFEPLGHDAYAKQQFPGAAELANMFKYAEICNYEFCEYRDPAQSKKLNPGLQTFEEWVKEHASEFPIPK